MTGIKGLYRCYTWYIPGVQPVGIEPPSPRTEAVGACRSAMSAADPIYPAAQDIIPESDCVFRGLSHLLASLLSQKTDCTTRLFYTSVCPGSSGSSKIKN